MATSVETLKASSPDGAMKTNADFVLDEYAQALALAPQVTRPQDTVDLLRQQQQQIAEMAQKIEMLKTGAEAAKGLAETDQIVQNG